jgi:myo-inositol 2-dehydrogenase / D-chiro-inositol 1-dehydrogenase
MNKTNFPGDVSRRQFLKGSSLAVAGVMVAPYVITTHAAADDPICLGLIGCGGRGMGAIGNALAAAPNVKLIAIADLFPEKLKVAREQLSQLGAKGNASWAPGTETTELKGVSIKLDDDH